MKLFLLLVIAASAVKCDDGSFKVYWNVPTFQCASRNMPFENLYGKFGILQNTDDIFNGDLISIMYNPGRFPSHCEKSSNGRVPQESDLTAHLAAFGIVVEQKIPDSNFSGVAIISFDGWRPTFRQNFNKLEHIKEISYEIERARDGSLTESEVKELAKEHFETAARGYFESTLALAKEMRPNARWGYYAYPYCFNMNAGTLREPCADRVPEENDELEWFWSKSSALFPTVHGSNELTPSQLTALVSVRVNEALRLKPDAVVLPYFKYQYENGGYYSEEDFKTTLSAARESGASGLIIWGSSNDVNTYEKCTDLYVYLEKTLGPAAAEFLKSI